MKKIIFASLALVLLASPAQAKKIDLDQLASALDSVSDSKGNSPIAKLDNITAKIEEKVNKLTDRIEARVEKYEKKFDEYEAKIDKAEKATDKIINTLNSFDQTQVEQYVKLAKLAAIAFALIFVTSFILLIFIFVQSMRITSLLQKIKKAA